MWENTSSIDGSTPASGQNYGWASDNANIPNAVGNFNLSQPQNNNQVLGLFVPVNNSGYGATAATTYYVVGANSCVFSEDVTIEFTQPSTSVSNMSPSMEIGYMSGLTNTEWTEADNWYKYVTSGGISKWEMMSNVYPTSGCEVYVMNSANDICVSDINNYYC